MNTFDERKKSFEKKFVNDQELQFKVDAKKNKYIGEWAAKLMKKDEKETQAYILEVIKSDFEEPGDEDVLRKIKNDLKKYGLIISDEEIRNQMDKELERAKKDFL